MPLPSNRFDRARYNGAHVDLRLALTAGSAAWSLAGRGSLGRLDRPALRRPRVEPGDRALPIVNRN